MSNKASVIGAGFSESDGRAQDAHTMADLAIGMGYETTSLISSPDYSVTKAEFLDALTALVTDAKPGDNLLFSFSGVTNQTSPNHGGTWEPDNKTELVQLADGAVTDDEILAVLKQLPQGANLTMAMDCSHASGVPDLDLGQYVPGNVVLLSSTSEQQTDQGSDVSFPQLLSQVVQENPGISWSEAMAKVDEMNGDLTCNATANNANLLTQPAFGTTDDGAIADDAVAACADHTTTEAPLYTETTELDNGNTVLAQVFVNGDERTTTYTTYDECGNQIDYHRVTEGSAPPQPAPVEPAAVCDLAAAQQQVADDCCAPPPSSCCPPPEEPTCC